MIGYTEQAMKKAKQMAAPQGPEINVPLKPPRRLLDGLLPQKEVELLRERPMPKNWQQFPPAPPWQPQQVAPAPEPPQELPLRSVLKR